MDTNFHKIFFQNNPQPLFIYETKTWKFLDVNKSALKLYGYTKGEFLNLTLLDIMPESESKRLKKILNNLKFNRNKKNAGKIKGIWIHKIKNGNQLKIEITQNEIDYKNVKCNLVFINDVTEKLTIEEKYKKLSEATTEAIVLHDKGKIISVNKAFEKLFGYKANEAIGKSVLHFTAERSRVELITNIKKGIINTYSAYGLHKNGKEFLCELTPREIDYFGKKIRVTCIRDISFQTSILQKLQESQRFITSIVNNLQGTIYRCLNDKNWTIQYVSPNIYQLTGYKESDFLKHKIFFNKLILEEYRDFVWKEVQKALRKKQPYTITYPIFNKKKELVWLWEHGSGIFENDKVIGLEGYLVDITQQRNKEIELENNKKAFIQLVEESPDGIFIHYNGVIQYANKIFLKLLGFKNLSQAISKNILDFVAPKHKKLIAKQIKETVQSKILSFIEFDMLLPNGKTKKVEIKGTPIIFNNKNCVQVVLHDLSKKDELQQQKLRTQIAEETNKVLSREIIYRKKVEEELKRAQLFSSNLIHSSLDIIMAADKNKIITEVNKACLDAFGYEYSELIGKKTSIIFADLKQEKIIDKSLKEKGIFKGEVLNIDKSGRVFVCYLSASVIRDDKGNVAGSMGISRDITEQKRNELILKQSEENYKSLFQKAYIGFAKIALSGVVIEANPRFNEIFKITDENFPINFKDILAPDDYLYILDLIEKLLKGTIKNFAEEVLCLDTKGNKVYVNISCSLSRNEKKEPEYYVVLLEDITQKKKNEEKAFLQAAKLNAVFESSAHLIWTVNKNNVLTSFNSNFSQTVHKIFGKIVDPYKTKLTQIFNENDYDSKWVENYRDAFNGKIKQFEIELIDQNGNNRWFEIYLYPIFSLKLEVFEVSALGNEITYRKISQQKIAETAAKLNSIFEGSSHLIFTLNSDLVFTSCNKNFLENVFNLTGLKIQINSTRLTDVILLLGKVYQPWQDAIIKAFNGEPYNFEFEFFDKNNILYWLDVYIQPIKNNENINEISVIAHDITDKKVAIEKSLLQAARIKSIFQNSSLMIYSIDQNYVLTSFNENYARFVESSFGIRPYEGQNLSSGFNVTDNPAEFTQLKSYHNLALEGNSLTYEREFKTKTGKIYWFENHLDPIVLPNGKIEGVTYISRDITEKKEAEKKLIESYREKEVLLKEVHHRVKNNLQVISSILSLQSANTKDPSVLTIIRESQNRIKSMSFIHETLYQTKNFSNINFPNYLRKIVTNLVQTYQLEENKVTIKFDLDDVRLDLDTSIPCGLIFNELVSNALKYAFKGKSKGIIFVEMKKTNDLIRVRIKDNGVGLPKNMDISNSESLGLQLVTALTEQIGGKLEYFSTEGTEFIITFMNKLKSAS